MTLLLAEKLTAELDTGHGRARVLDALSLGLAAGEIVDVVGPSGTGKTTLLRALARLLPHVSGSLALDGRPASELTPQQWRRAVGLVPQVPSLVPGSIGDNLLLPWSLKVRSTDARPDPDELRTALAGVGLGELELERDATRLSTGQQARIALLRVLLGGPRVVLLDEADAALDDESASLVAAAARTFAENGGGVLRVRHRASDGFANRRLRLGSGRLTEVAS